MSDRGNEIRQAPGGAEFTQPGRGVLRVVFTREDILHIKYCFSEQASAHASYAVIRSPEENVNPAMAREAELSPLPAVEFRQEEGAVFLRSAALDVQVELEPLAVLVKDRQGRTLHRDVAGRSYTRDANLRSTHCFELGDYTAFYGFGEKTGRLNKYGRRMRMYSCDTMGYNSETTDPLYKHIPFFIKKDAGRGLCCGVFYDCPRQGVMDMGCERSGYWPRYGLVSFDGGDLDYYVIAGPEMKQVVRGYAWLTGTTALPTSASLGYMASTMYFTESERDSDRQILQFVENLERHGLGCDGFHLSSGYTTQQGKRCVFCWNNDRFPDPEAFLRRMEELGVPVSPNIKPALLTEHPLYGEFRDGNAFFTDPETGSPSLERYWGGWASLVDFTSEGGRALWKKHLTRSLLEKGARSLWDDNNEYEIFDERAMCAGDGTPCPAVQLKPVFANLMAQTGIEALGEFDPEARPYVLSRAGYAGIQRYAQTWAGDNYTSWNDLKYNIPVMLGMGLSGVANQGCDVGGFQGPAPDGELFVRWVENGIFQPRFCIHSCNTDNTVTQPLSYGSLTGHVQSAFRLRYALGLYLYSCMRQSNLLGDPVMRALPYEFGDDPRADSDFDFMFGPWLLVANVLEPGAVERTVYLPAGCDWYDWHTHRRFAGGQTVCVPAPMGRIPLFYRAGCILPLIDPAQHMQLGRLPHIRLLVEDSRDSSFVLYQDDGKTNRWRRGDYLETAVSTRVEPGATDLRFARSGNWDCGPRTFEIELVHAGCAPLNVRLNDRPLPMLLEADAYEAAQEGWYFDLETRHARIRVQDPGTDFCLRADYQIKDLVAM